MEDKTKPECHELCIPEDGIHFMDCPNHYKNLKENKTIEDILKLFEETFVIDMVKQPPQGFLWPQEAEKIKDFIKKAIKKSIEDITPERNESSNADEGWSEEEQLLCDGWNDCLSQLEDNIDKLLNL